MGGKKWTIDEIKIAVDMIKNGKNFKEIGIKLNKSQISVNNKLHRLGYKSSYTSTIRNNKGQTKYSNYNWNLIQKEYNTGLTYRNISNKFNLSIYAIMWAKNNNKLIFRSKSEGIKLAWNKGKFNKNKKEGFERYRQLCEFKFSIKDYPNKFDTTIIKKNGWYKAKNRGNVINGVNRDHMYSIKNGFINNVDPLIISHPANCQLILHSDNLKKHSKSNITLEELKKRIKNW